MVNIKRARGKTQSIWLIIGSIILLAVLGSLLFDENSGVNSLLSSGTARFTADYSSIDHASSSFNYQLAAHESLGFFQDVPEKDWLIRKKHTNAAEHHVFPPKKHPERPMKTPAGWYQNNFNEDFSCFNEVAIGGIGDGHKYVCDPHRLESFDDCLVYSVGSNGNFRFEEGLLALAPNCEIHIFDPDDYESKMESRGMKNAHYHQWGLHTSYKYNQTAVSENYGDRFQDGSKLSNLAFKTLQETMAELGHVGRRIDMFKIDCEGCEWRTYRDWIFGNVDLRQIFIEVHNYPLIGNTFFEDIHKQGYVIFHKEPNIQWGGGNCVEFSFLKLHQDFFK
jgi:hypothetical protein